MNPSNTKVVTALRRLLAHTPLYRPFRFLFNKLFLFRARRTVTVDDISLRFRTPTFKLLDDFERLDEVHILRKMLDIVREGDTVWDVGAHVGFYALFAAHRVGPSGRVIAFEPEPRTRKLLRDNALLNRLENVTIREDALDVKNGIKELYTSATANIATHSFVQRRDYKLRRRGVHVQTSRGDTLVSEHNVGVPDIVKIDVEGSEYNVLSGMGTVLNMPSVRMLVVEVHPVVLPLFGSSDSEVERLIRSANFSRTERIDRGAEYHLLCYKS